MVPRDGIEPPSVPCKGTALPLDERGKSINNCMNAKIKTIMSDLGTVLIWIGVLIIVAGIYTGLGYYIWDLLDKQEYVWGGLLLSATLIVNGGLLKLIFRKQ